LHFTVNHISELAEVASSVIELMKEYRIFLLNGEMGVGKTTFMKVLGQQLQLKDEVSSPTYSIANEYVLPNEKKLFHFDLYRIKEMEELLEMGFEEYIYSDDYCFIEWPQIARELLTDNLAQINIQVKNEVRFIELLTS